MNITWSIQNLRENVGEFDRYHLDLRSPIHRNPIKYGPKPLVSPYGPNYSMHPELSRSPLGALIRTAVPFVLTAAPYVPIPMLALSAAFAGFSSASEGITSTPFGNADYGVPV